MRYLVTAMIAVVVVAVWAAYIVSRRESRLVYRPSMTRARRMVRGQRLVSAGDQCVCGGVLGPSGRESDKLGPLLGCTGCNRSWTMSGRRIMRRTVPPPPPPEPPPA